MIASDMRNMGISEKGAGDRVKWTFRERKKTQLGVTQGLRAKNKNKIKIILLFKKYIHSCSIEFLYLYLY